MHRTLPNPVRWATILWTVAIAAGSTESSLAVAPGLVEGGAVPWLALVTRVLLYAFSAMVVAWFARGEGWARVTLVVLMTGVGLAGVLVSMGFGLLPGVGVLVDLGHQGHGVALALRAVNTFLYLPAVVVATVTSFLPASDRYFSRADHPRVLVPSA